MGLKDWYFIYWLEIGPHYAGFPPNINLTVDLVNSAKLLKIEKELEIDEYFSLQIFSFFSMVKKVRFFHHLEIRRGKLEIWPLYRK